MLASQYSTPAPLIQGVLHVVVDSDCEGRPCGLRIVGDIGFDFSAFLYLFTTIRVVSDSDSWGDAEELQYKELQAKRRKAKEVRMTSEHVARN